MTQPDGERIYLVNEYSFIVDTPDPFESSPDDTHAEMMQATYDALQKHGYSDLTIQRIGDEFPKSKSLVYQHYDGKDELLVDFLAFMLDHFESGFHDEDRLDPRERLDHVLDGALGPTRDDDERAAFTRAITTLRGQAPYDERFRDRFTETDRALREHLTAILRDGVETGQFRDVDPERVAEYVVTTLHGATLRRSTTDDEFDSAAVRDELDAYLDRRLGIPDER